MPFFNFRYIPLLLAIVTLFSAENHGVPFIHTQKQKSTIQSRNFYQFGSLIDKMVHDFFGFGYNGYGCWCGKGHRGDLVVDGTDHCCQIHDRCWGAAEQNIASCSPFIETYSYEMTPNKEIQCADPVGTCDYGTCLCDKAAVECFARYRNSSYDPDFDNWEGLCNETSKKPGKDPERCPPVWNADEKYPAGSRVSVKGIVYESLYLVGPGGFPTNHTRTSMFAGIQATWKRLEPCRRTNLKDKF